MTNRFKFTDASVRAIPTPAIGEKWYWDTEIKGLGTVAANTAQRVSDRLSRAFLMHSSVQRDAERVTATEWNQMVSELEQALGGVYSVLSEDFQRPLIEISAWRMSRSGKLPKLPKELVKPTIITGVEALGRSKDLQNLRGFTEDLASIGQVKPQALDRIDDGELISRMASTKVTKRALAQPYHLTYSRTEANDADCVRVLKAGGNVAAVFAGPLPDTWNGFPVIDGDESDWRPEDGRGVVVGLKAKGAARKDQSGFVIR